MAVKGAIQNRRSIRNFDDREVPPELLIEIIESARWAPSATNRQPCRYIVVIDQSIRLKIARYARLAFVVQKHVKNAPAIIVVCIPTRKTRWAQFDAGAAIQNILLRSFEIGLGTCWIGAFNQESIAKILSIPDEYRAIALVVVGYASQVPSSPGRLSLGEIAYQNKWGENIATPLPGKSGIRSILSRRVSGVFSKNQRVLIAADGILYNGRQIVLIKRKGTTYRGFWALPGGMLDPGERIEETLVREMQEEVNVTVTPKEILGVYSGVDRDPRGSSVSVAFICEWSGEPKAADDAEDVGTFELEDALKLQNLAFDHKKIIHQFKEYIDKKQTFWSSK